ncbi:MAG: iron ABC transporter permease [Anaerolineales bacterium]|nr:iron ABC transporter permease [Anaerolineales bacterium]
MAFPTVYPQSFSLQLLAAGRRFFRWLTSAHVILALLMLVLMVYLILVPLYRMFETTLTYQEKDIYLDPDAEVGQFTFFHWVRMLTGQIAGVMTYTPLQHSLVISIGATLLALLIGSALAWMTIRTDMPGRNIINTLATLPYIMPSWTIAMAWTVLFKNRTSGGAPGIYEYLIGQSPPDWIAWGPVPIIISSALHYYTFFYLFVSAALMSIDSNLEEAGELMGASRWRILRKITFPLIIPALLSGFIMTFSKVMGTFGGPNVLGIPVGYYTLSTMIRSNMGLGNYADGFVLAITLIMFAMTTVYINQRVVGTRKSYETIGGRGFVAHLTKLRNWKFASTALVITFQLVVAIVPLFLLTLNTFMLRDGVYSLENFTLHYWIGESTPLISNGVPGVLRNPDIYKGAWNSIALSLWTAFFTAFLGIILGYAIAKGRGTRLSKLVEQLAFVPYVIPGIAFGAVYISMFAKPVGPIPALYGTFALLVIVSVAKHIPYSARTGVSAMLQVGRELEEAGQVANANAWERFRRIIFPLTSPGFVSGFLLTFISTMRELSLIILLVTPSTQVLASMTIRYLENDDTQMANAVIIILVALVLIGNFIITRFRGGSLKQGLGM